MKEIRSLQWIKQLIGARTQEEWLSFVKDKLCVVKAWSDNHGQKALIYGLLVGFFVAVFFKIFMLMLAVSCILAFLIYELAPEKIQQSEEEYDLKVKTTHLETSHFIAPPPLIEKPVVSATKSSKKDILDTSSVPFKEKQNLHSEEKE